MPECQYGLDRNRKTQWLFVEPFSLAKGVAFNKKGGLHGTQKFAISSFPVTVFRPALFLLSCEKSLLLVFRNVSDHSSQPRVALRHSAVNLIGMEQRQGILHESRLLQLSMVKVFQKISFWFLLQCHPGRETIVGQLDIEQVFHACRSHLNVFDLE